MQEQGFQTKEILHLLSKKKLPYEVKAALQSYLVSDKDQEEKEKALREVWNSTQRGGNKRKVEKAYCEFVIKASLDPAAIQDYRRLRTRVRHWAAAAAIVLPLLLGVTAWTYSSYRTESAKMQEFAVPMGQRQEIKLPDGTVAVLNAGSMLVYPKRFGGRTRTVYLIGEGNFDVFKDRRHPFIVKTSVLSVEALGTKFNLNAYADSKIVSAVLENGLILIRDLENPENKMLLRPDEQVEMDCFSRNLVKSSVNASLSAAWTHGQLNFVNKSLSDIVSTLQRYYNTKIYLDPRLSASDSYTLKLQKDESLEQVMRLLEKAVHHAEIKYSEKGDIMLLFSDNAKGGEKR